MSVVVSDVVKSFQGSSRKEMIKITEYLVSFSFRGLPTRSEIVEGYGFNEKLRKQSALDRAFKRIQKRERYVIWDQASIVRFKD